MTGICVPPAISGYLCPAGEARFYHVPEFKIRNGISPVPAFINRQRPRPDKAHLTFENINQLRQFVQVCFPQELAKGKNTRISNLGYNWFPFFMAGFNIRPHRAKLITIKHFTIQPGSFLNKQYRPFRSQFNGKAIKGYINPNKTNPIADPITSKIRFLITY